MSIRVVLAILYVLFFSIYAWRKNWFVGLCGLVILMAFVQHPDMPNSIAGVPGLNLWNILLVNVLFAWLNQRNRENLKWDLPRHVTLLGYAYFAVMVVATTRLFLFRGVSLFTAQDIISEFFINTYKWVIPAILFYDGCRTKKRVETTLIVVICMYLLIAIQVIKVMPVENIIASGDELQRRAARILSREVGYHRVNLSMMLGGASWAALLTLLVLKKNSHTLMAIGAAGIISFGQALTGGRTGYATWIMVGIILGILKWRRILIIVPIALTAVITFVPGVKERMLMGIQGGGEQINTYTMTSGRTLIWPYVIQKINEKPIWGYGRQAMQSTGLATTLLAELNEGFPHPHNAYLEALFDNGIIGFAVVLLFYGMILRHSFRLLLKKNDPFCSMIGGMCSALVLSLLIASLGSQTFYPREGAVGMWVVMGIMMRISVESSKMGSEDMNSFKEQNGAEA